jgi:hypothetical protein
LYRKREKKVLQFIKDELVGYCQNGQFCDQIGNGAALLIFFCVSLNILKKKVDGYSIRKIELIKMLLATTDVTLLKL